MRVVRLAVMLILSMSAHLVVASPTLCAKDEAVFFSCPLKDSNKVVSLCGDRGLMKSREEGENSFLVYRFGRLGALELEYPKRRDGSIEMFSYSRYESKPEMGDFDLTEVLFSISEFKYRIFDDYLPREGRKVQDQHKSGVEVYRKGKVVVELLCGERPKSDLWSLANILSGDDE